MIKYSCHAGATIWKMRSGGKEGELLGKIQTVPFQVGGRGYLLVFPSPTATPGPKELEWSGCPMALWKTLGLEHCCPPHPGNGIPVPRLKMFQYDN